MSEPTPFAELIRRVRAGEGDAATELVRRYEPALRTAVRVRLTDARLRRLFDSMDVCQSVLGAFFVRIAAGGFELETPAQLVKLLATMARNRLLNLKEEAEAAVRDVRRNVSPPPDQMMAQAPGPTPSQAIATRELLERVRERLSDEERYLAEQRALGRSWAELAEELGTAADALRMRLRRAIERVSRELGME